MIINLNYQVSTGNFDNITAFQRLPYLQASQLSIITVIQKVLFTCKYRHA